MSRLIAGRYRLGEEIGAGGSSRVYRAVDERLARPVALKLMDARVAGEADPVGRERFLREAQTSACFLHPNAVTVFDAGEDGDDLFIVMELVEGTTLAAHLSSADGPLAFDEIERITDQVLAGLAAAHDRGIVHRDVKPANVLLGPDLQVKLADFGIAKRFDELDASITSTGIVLGTPRYLAPEVVLGREISPATDVYSVGILLFEMLTGEFPFQGDTPIAVAVAHQTQPVPDLRELRADAPATIVTVVERAVAKEPADRYATAADLRADLAQVWGRAGATPVALPAGAVTARAGVAGHGGDTAVLTSPPTVALLDTSVSAGRPGVEPGPIDPPTAALDRAALDPGPPTEPDAVPASAGNEPRTITHAQLAAGLAVLVAIALLGAAAFGGFDGMNATGLSGLQAQGEEAAPPDPALVEEVPPPGPAPAEEIIPGFAVPADLWEFLAQLEHDPALVGEAGDDLLDDLRQLLGSDSPREQRELAISLREELREWVEDGELHPAIAEALDAHLAPIAEQPVESQPSQVSESSNQGGANGPPPGRGNARGRD
jgi:eukaryotic-like serine/threonine-protein kinase